MATDKCIIYGLFCLCHPADGVRYVGQTCTGIRSRFSLHLNSARKGEAAPVYNWMRKHGADNIAWTVLEICLAGELDQREAVWIDHYRSEQGAKLMNVRTGGFQSRGHKRTPEQIERMTGANNHQFGKNRSELMAYARSFQGSPSAETRKKLSEAGKGRIFTEESRRKMSESRKALLATPEHQERLSARFTGEGNVAAKVNEDDVRAIRKIREETGAPYAKIGEPYGLTPEAVSKMCRRITWAHVE